MPSPAQNQRPFPRHRPRDGKPHNGRLVTIPTNIRLDSELWEWVNDRAAIIGVPYTTLLRDVIATWRTLVLASEQEAGLVLDLPELQQEYENIQVPERVPGYRSALLPSGNKPSHLDSSPLTPREL